MLDDKLNAINLAETTNRVEEKELVGSNCCA